MTIHHQGENPRVTTASGSLAKNFLLSPFSSSEDFKIKVKCKQGRTLRNPYGPCPQVRWFEALPGDQMAAQAAHSLGHPPAWSGGRGVPDGWDWADTPEYMPLPDAIWTHPLDFDSHESSGDKSR